MTDLLLFLMEKYIILRIDSKNKLLEVLKLN